MIEPSRRGFITGLIALVAAPAIVRAGSLMPVKSLDDFDLMLMENVPYEYSAKYVDVVRRAFVPRLYVQMWNETPAGDLIRSLQ